MRKKTPLLCLYCRVFVVLEHRTFVINIGMAILRHPSVVYELKILLYGVPLTTSNLMSAFTLLQVLAIITTCAFNCLSE